MLLGMAAARARPAASGLYALLLAAAVLVGFRESMAGPYLTLFAVERAHLGPLALGAFLTARAVGGVGFSMVFGAWFDRSPTAVPILVSLAAGAAGYAMMAATVDLPLLLLIALLPLGVGAAAFPLVFAMAKSCLGGGAAPGERVRAERAIAILRACFSVAWGIGPALGAAVLGAARYDRLFAASALCGLAACGTLAGLGRRPLQHPGAAPPSEPVEASPAVGLTAASFTAYAMAMVMGMVALPIVVIRDLGGSTGDVGLITSLSAMGEVPVMAAVALRPRAVGGYGGMVVGFVAFVLFFLLAGWAPGVGAMVAVQVLRALAIGLVSCVSIGYMQDLMPGRAGAAAALYANTGQVGALLAGLAAGGWAALFGYHSMFWACAALSALGLALLALGARRASAR